MAFNLEFTDQADHDLRMLEQNRNLHKRLKAVRKTLAYLENNTPAAYRVFWHYGLGQQIITIVAITPHP